MDKDKKEKRLSDYDNTGQLGVTEMFGAIFFMLIGGLKKDYNYYYQVKYQKRNIRIGYILSVAITLIFSYSIYLFLISDI
jgi:Kef-type K+ transport system membrane component KefB